MRSKEVSLLKEYTAPGDGLTIHSFCPLSSFFRQHHLSYPYWTDFPSVSSHDSPIVLSAKTSPLRLWLGFHLLILLNDVLVNIRCAFLTRLTTFRDVTVANLPAGRASNYLTYWRLVGESNPYKRIDNPP